MLAPRLRLPLYGLLSGVLLSALRAPLGLDWTQLAVVSGGTAALFRAAALVAIALFIDPRRPAFRAGTQPLILLPSVAVGFLVHGLFLSLALQPGCRLGLTIALLGATLALWLAAGPLPKSDRGAEPPEQQERLPRAERLGLLLAAAGAALSIETVAQQVRLLGQQLPADDTVFGGFLLLWISLMAILFGFSVKSSVGKAGVLSALGLTVSAAAGVYSLQFLKGLDREGLWFFLKHVPLGKLDPEFIATWQADAWIAATSLVPVGLGLAIALLGARHAGRLASMLLGAALGLMLRPYAIQASARPLSLPAELGTPWAWQLVTVGTVLGAIGCMLCARSLWPRARLAASLSALSVGVLPLILGPVTIWNFSPWLKYDVQPRLVIPSASGLISVEPRPLDELQVNIDRRRLTPGPRELGVDELRISYSLALLDPERLSSGQAKVLLLGQITPERNSILRLNKVKHLDRSAAWFDAFGSIEQELFPAGQQPLGQGIPPALARARIREGKYDLVIALPSAAPDLIPRGRNSLAFSSSPAPTFGSLKVPEGTIGVAWVDASAPLHTRSMGDWVLLAMGQLEHLSVGIVIGDVDPVGRAGRPLLFAAGQPLWPSSIWTETPRMLNQMVRRRVFGPREALLTRLGKADEELPSSKLARALAKHFALQTDSSPFETSAYAIEWDEKVFAELFGALGALERLDPFSRNLGEDLFWLLGQKRLADLTVVYGEAVAERFAPWPAADRALGFAYQELLEPGTALRFWQRAIDAEPYNLDTYMRYADAAIEAEQPERAVKSIRGALKLQPGRFDLRRALAIALLKSEAPEAKPMLLELHEEHPSDNHIRGALGMQLVPESEDHSEH